MTEVIVGSMENTNIRPLSLDWVLDNLPQHIDRRLGLDGDASAHALLVDKPDQLFRVRLRRGRRLG